jgi:hypothetical protein
MIALLLLVIAANVGQALSLSGPAESRPHVAIRYPQVAPRVVRID